MKVLIIIIGIVVSCSNVGLKIGWHTLVYNNLEQNAADLTICDAI